MKGFSFIFGLIIVTFLLIIGALMPYFVLRVHIQRYITYEIKNTNAQLVLLSLLSSTHEENGVLKPIYEILAEYIALHNTPDQLNIDFLRSIMNDLFENQPYKLYYFDNGNEVILGQLGDPETYTFISKIVVPYNSDKLFKELYLVVD
jgi:hypothetical protein